MPDETMNEAAGIPVPGERAMPEVNLDGATGDFLADESLKTGDLMLVLITAVDDTTMDKTPGDFQTDEKETGDDPTLGETRMEGDAARDKVMTGDLTLDTAEIVIEANSLICGTRATQAVLAVGPATAPAPRARCVSVRPKTIARAWNRARPSRCSDPLDETQGDFMTDELMLDEMKDGMANEFTKDKKP